MCSPIITSTTRLAEYGLEMTEEDQSQAENAANSLWSYYGSTFEELGIAQSSFQKAYGEYNVKSQKVMQAMYGEGRRAGPGGRRP